MLSGSIPDSSSETENFNCKFCEFMQLLCGNIGDIEGDSESIQRIILL